GILWNAGPTDSCHPPAHFAAPGIAFCPRPDVARKRDRLDAHRRYQPDPAPDPAISHRTFNYCGMFRPELLRGPTRGDGQKDFLWRRRIERDSGPNLSQPA